MYICIAGGNNIAVQCTDYLLSNKLVSEKDLLVSFNKTDQGIDHFQRSFKKYCYAKALKETSLHELCDISNLVLISLQYNRIIPVSNFKSRSLFNIHYSMLPKYKGMYTSVWPILNGDETSGVSLHEIDSGIDTGNIVDQAQIAIDCEDTARDLYFKYTDCGIALFKKNIMRLLSTGYTARKQEANGSTYYSRSSLNFSDITIDLNKTAFEIKNQIRAFNFREYQIPCIFSHEIVAAEIQDSRTIQTPGSILHENEQYIEIATVDFDLRLIKARQQAVEPHT